MKNNSITLEKNIVLDAYVNRVKNEIDNVKRLDSKYEFELIHNDWDAGFYLLKVNYDGVNFISVYESIDCIYNRVRGLYVAAYIHNLNADASKC